MKGRILASTGALVIVLSSLGGSPPRPATHPTTARAEPVPRAELLAELKAAPTGAAQRGRKLVELFKQAGIKDVKTQTIPRNRGRFNVVATLPGEGKDVIVVGAHTDCDRRGRGVIDDWSGATMAANLAQALAKGPRRHTFVFVGFDLEEVALTGSRYYVSRLSDEQKRRVRAMVNLECLGVSKTFIWRTGSADDLEALALKVARQASIPVKARQLRGVGADSNSFMYAGIPAITFDSLEKKDFHLIDSRKDRFENINADNFHEQHRYLLKFLLALDVHEGKISRANKDRRPPPVVIGFAPEKKPFTSGQALIVDRILPGCPEDKAGMKKGDRIVEFGGTVIKAPTDILGGIRVLKRGDTIKVKVKRGDKEVVLTVQY